MLRDPDSHCGALPAQPGSAPPSLSSSPSMAQDLSLCVLGQCRGTWALSPNDAHTARR